ncbi:MAG: hypothetical protein ABEK59_01660 [Halobacteria archaeon]
MLNRFGIGLLVMFFIAGMTLVVAVSRWGLFSANTGLILACWIVLVAVFGWLGRIGAERIKEKRQEAAHDRGVDRRR